MWTGAEKGLLISMLENYTSFVWSLKTLVLLMWKWLGLFLRKNHLLRSWGWLSHWNNVASSNLFYRYYFGKCSSELAQLVSLSYSWGRSTCYSDRLHDFSATIPICYKYVYVNSFFTCTARLWNLLPVECFPFIYDLSGLSLEFTDIF